MCGFFVTLHISNHFENILNKHMNNVLRHISGNTGTLVTVVYKQDFKLIYLKEAMWPSVTFTKTQGLQVLPV